MCHGPTLADPLQKSETDSKRRFIFLVITMFLGQKNRQNPDKFKVNTFFLEITMFLEQNIDKIGTDSKL